MRIMMNQQQVAIKIGGSEYMQRMREAQAQMQGMAGGGGM